VRVAVYGSSGKVGSVLVPALKGRGWSVQREDPAGADVAVDFTTPEGVVRNVLHCLALAVPVVIGTTGWLHEEIDLPAREAAVPVFFAPNFAIGAVVMMNLSALAAATFPNAHIVEMHDATKRDAPSGSATTTAAVMGTNPAISSIRLPGVVAHQEVIFAGHGEVLTIRHDTLNRNAFVGGVLLAIERVRSLPPGLTVGLDKLLSQ
jgi:4-hydroxy-tetrahydrodipicolinate reductase